MIVCRDRAQLRKALDGMRGAEDGIGFVPTMGYLHDGHAALVRRARRDGLLPVLSVFVNPLQFGAGEDFARYPRDEAHDLALAEAAGVEVVYLPPVEDIVPATPRTQVTVPSLLEGMCALARPEHFPGVAMIVLRLLARVRPRLAYFGEKDAQQLAVVRQVVRDLEVGVGIVAVPTVREPGGLALSSRNAYLSEAERRQALALYQSLQAGEGLLRLGERDPAKVRSRMWEVLTGRRGVQGEYAVVVDPDRLAVPDRIVGRTLLAVAARVGPTRLIDNLRLWVPAAGGPSALLDDPEGAEGRERQRIVAANVAEAVAVAMPERTGAWREAAVDAVRGATAVDPQTLVQVLAGVRVATPRGEEAADAADLRRLGALRP